jgi:hypothetical protein
MRVDQQLIRRMLEAIELAPEPEIAFMPEVAPDPAAQRYHLQLLLDGGYVTGQQLRRYGPACALGLTVAGQDLLDKLRHKKPTYRSGRMLERLVTASAMHLLFGPLR